MINSVLQSSKVILIIFIAIFIIYSTNFFIRKRKKEIGLYSLLGITKKQISHSSFSLGSALLTWTVYTDTVPLVLHNYGWGFPYPGRTGWETAVKYT